MSNVEIHGRAPRWPSIRLGALMLWAFVTGYLLGHPDPRDWQHSTQTTQVTLTDPATGMQQIQYQTGVTESLTSPTPMTGHNVTLFGSVPDVDSK
jgi:hypothetical protein